MYKPYSQKTSLMVVSLIGCIALWVIVIAFTDMNNEIDRLGKEVTELKMFVHPSDKTAPTEKIIPTIPTTPPSVTPSPAPSNVPEPKTPPQSEYPAY
ncbi:MAG: hypothetical protein AAB870_04945 [Patescibacteria group bacterium]